VPRNSSRVVLEEGLVRGEELGRYVRVRAAALLPTARPPPSCPPIDAQAMFARGRVVPDRS